jgi:hypothetical protein
VVFRRRKRDEDDLPLDGEIEGAVDGDGRELDAAPADVAPERPVTTGPYDIADAPDDDIERLDLGGLRIPIPEGVELRVEVDPETQMVTSALAVVEPSLLQIGAFAAPRSEGIWAVIAEEILEGIRQAGGSVEPADGPFGRELRAHVPVDTPGQGRTMAPARFLGVDGPRWFLRGLLQGPAAENPAQFAVFEQIFRGIVVVRGGEAMAPRDALILRIPREMAEAAGTPVPAEPESDDVDQLSLDPFARGPEITETR